jgi:hypothetical protein
LGTSTGTEPGVGLRGALSIAFLGLAIGILALVMVWTLTAAVNPAAAGCHNAPLRVTRAPQVLGILVCIGGFVLGRITARPKVDSRDKVRSWVRDRHDTTGHARAAVFVQACLVAALLFIACLIAFEAVTLNRGVWPITYYMRCASEAATWQTLAAAFAFSLLTGRWMWLPTTPKDVD